MQHKIWAFLQIRLFVILCYYLCYIMLLSNIAINLLKMATREGHR